MHKYFYWLCFVRLFTNVRMKDALDIHVMRTIGIILDP